jgi:hypothetical protein
MRILIACILSLALTACDSSNGVDFKPAGGEDQDMGGLWSGLMSIEDPATGREIGLDMIAISTDEGALQAYVLDFGILTDAGIIISATAQVDGSVFTASGQAFAEDGTFVDGSTVTAITLEGDLMERNGVSGTWDTDAGVNGTFILDYDREHQRDSALSLIADTWYIYDDLLNPVATFSIDATGQLSGSNTQGCSSLGQISIPDNQYNVYSWSAEVSSCPIAGSYTGLGTLGDFNSINDIFGVIINSETRGQLLPLQR